MIENERERDRKDPRSSKTHEGGATARRLLWALAGAAAYTVAYFVAKYVFGF